MSVAEVAAGPVKGEPVEQPRALKRSAFQSGEFAYARMSATLPAGWDIEDALRPEFWVHVVDQFKKNPFTNDPDRVGAIIELRSEDHAFFAEVYVRAVQERGMVVALIGEPTYFGPKEIKADGFEVRWNVGKRGFDIIRKSDREIVAGGDRIKTREQAQAWIGQTTKAH
jgi:hypothetical protein